MARDYSGQGNKGPRNTRGKTKSKPKSGRPKPAARPAKKKSTRNGNGGGPPGWVWLICGLCIGLTVAAGFYVFGRPAGTGERQQIQIATPQASGSDDTDETRASGEQRAATPKEKEPRFSFYKMLPNYEVVIPEEEYPDTRNNSSNPTPGEPPPPSSSTTTRQPEPTTPRIDEPGRYIIQAGSFSTHDDADRRKAEISLLGVNARIVSVDLASGKTVYRVQSTPITSSVELNKMLQRLRKNRIDTLVMRAKK